ncbi:hypothetical protein ASPCADRAFT_204480 [Aspergillus carbonarius ITEM 5010]|uniref:Uncharacterized protein n=1 Tax=Aspergillus carbonarius (strain ITEM 5010) TaxID=602072 RepID=A0A1R3RW89_ASPC5|nr:hypothetical protein ASPCADRAFT_204480 [Aspergillus carbonarius ITEM 5010]
MDPPAGLDSIHCMLGYTKGCVVSRHAWDLPMSAILPVYPRDIVGRMDVYRSSCFDIQSM